MKAIRLLLVLFISVSFFSCKKEASSENNAVDAVTYTDISYGSDPLQKMDIFLPAGRSVAATKVIVMIHGGAWASGDKSEMTQYVDSFKRRMPDYAIFNINYRLSAAPANLFPAQENDVKAAVEFIAAKSAEYLISGKYAFLGASAGGHLAMLQGYKYTSPVKPKAIASLSGPTDLTEMYNNPVGGNPLLSLFLATAIGNTPTGDPQLYTNSSPVTFITSASPPTLLLYGDTDDLVSTTQPTLAKAKLDAAGVTNEYVLYNGAGHVDTWDSNVIFDAFNRIQAFLTANVQ